ncbi:hypothetical protein GmRootA79_19500 [Acidovorax sp. A79]|uniref:DUF2917 domain-containing protein n=1 Tax=Acidovorax sp. A79 TaxID=3056107 RepID=UPI0034E8F764
MSPRNVLESQQSVHASLAGRSAAGCWKLATGQALSLRPHTHGVLQIAQGQVWLTLSGSLADLPGATADHLLRAGEQLAVAPGQHVVMEAWNPGGGTEPVAFHWDGAAAPATTQPHSLAARDWECGVVQPLRDLGHALGQGGRALGAALGEVTGAGGRFAAGLARFALNRIAPQGQRRPA